ncbi:hypothetical protein CEQ90_03355 [Lewinellaceae bacterium SD302]|nr:hypothetical protein CEQ90_03355 [Lewinellaceae bacterium SD302]
MCYNFRFMNSSSPLGRLAALLLLVVSLASCGSDLAQSVTPTPTAFGKINALTVIADSSLWQAGISDSVDYFFGAPYIILPQPEPIFDINYISPERLSGQPTWQQLRNYIVMADLSDDNSPTTQMVLGDMTDEKIQQVRREGFGTAVANNKWAVGQQLIYLMGKDLTELKRGLSTAYPAVVKRIKLREEDRIGATTYFEGAGNRSIEKTVLERTGARLRIPGDYQLAPLEDTSVVWLRKDIPEGSVNIMMSTVPYENQSQLTREGLKSLRNQLGEKYISSTTPGTFMRINDHDLPLFMETTDLNGNYALEGRGIWEMENGYMAGPFVSYLVHDPEQENLLFIDGFVHAPGKKKRNLMEELTYVLRTTDY